MSDLRESGCLTADTRILRADTGAETTMGELFAAGATDVPVWALDDSLRYVRRHLTHVFSTGQKEVFRLRLASGKEVRATANHPFLAYEGWTPLRELAVGSRVAVPRHVPAPERVASWDDAAVLRVARRVTAGLDDCFPGEVFHLPKRQIAVLLRELFSLRGTVLPPSGASNPGIVEWQGTGSAARDVSRLLLRFGISTTTRRDVSGTVLRLADADDRRRFLQEIGISGHLADAADRVLDRARCDTVTTPGHISASEVWQTIGALISEQSSVGAPGQDGAVAVLPRIAEQLDQADLDVHAVNDVLWDEVVAVHPDGVEEVFDATVLGTHNFIANGIAVHNSIEQDADMVILLHREDAYERESPRAGEADFIVAKHRNGPTDTIVVAFQGHYSRFVDMAQGG